MEYMDEKIIEMMNNMQEEQNQNARKSRVNKIAQQDMQKTLIKIKGEIIPFEEKNLLENKVKIPLPKTFTIMSPEMASLKYPSERRPELIYTNETASINMAFSHTQNPLNDTDMGAFKNSMVQILRQTQPLARWFEEGIRNVNGKNIGFCEFLAPSFDANIYNLLFFVELEGRALLCIFNCVEEEMKSWKPIARGIMDSLKITVDEKGDIRR
ncbi:hypothetical protein P4S83_10790 [Aneurinibacillus thermoaerophilus]|uniref:hypothetical protein n=3 Tax=Aneurinibacillus thermoaerophilus TaxID=143495 RepID=UPI0030C9519E